MRRKAFYKWSILSLIFLIIAYSCEDKEKDFLEEKLTVSPISPREVPMAGGRIEFTIETNTPNWEYTIINADWLKEISKDARNLILEASSNTAGDERLALISFSTSPQSNTKQEIKVYQAGTNIKPSAHILDMIFKPDGTAEDVSSLKNTVLTLEGGSMTTLYSDRFQRYIARFNHDPGGTSSVGYYKVDYSTNQTFKNALTEGHTLEAMFMLDIDKPYPNSEMKMLSSNQNGGTGLLVGNHSNNSSIMFLPHIGRNYVFTDSKIVPERGKYYHVVGVWNKQEGKTYIYVDGVLRASENAVGNLNLPTFDCHWFGIGIDPAGTSSGHMGWKGDVILSRIYDKALSKESIALLWSEVKDLKPKPDEVQLSDISLLSKNVQINATYSIKGKGFITGDKVKLNSMSNEQIEYICDANVSEGSLDITIPSDFKTDKYRFFILRADKTVDIGFATLTLTTNPSLITQIIAHRGYWKAGAPQNSIAAFIKAQELDVYGSEFDLWITTDGKVVANHDPTINGIKIEDASYDQLKHITLSNGEKLPTLEDCLEQAKKDLSTKLILEIKTHSGTNNNNRVSAAVVNMVKNANMTNQVEYIAFSLDVCKKILELQPDAIVAYLNGDLTPQQVHNLKIKGIDYNISIIRKNKSWVSEAQGLGMFVNVWTVNGESDIQEMINMGVNFISTDYPELAKKLIEQK